MQLAAGVMVDDGVVNAAGQLHIVVADQCAQRIAQGGGHRVLVAGDHGGIDRGDEFRLAGEFNQHVVDGVAAGIVHAPSLANPRLCAYAFGLCRG